MEFIQSNMYSNVSVSDVSHANHSSILTSDMSQKSISYEAFSFDTYDAMTANS